MEVTLRCLFLTSATNNQGLAYQVSALHNLRPALRISVSEKENTGVMTSFFLDFKIFIRKRFVMNGFNYAECNANEVITIKKKFKQQANNADARTSFLL